MKTENMLFIKGLTEFFKFSMKTENFQFSKRSTIYDSQSKLKICSSSKG